MSNLRLGSYLSQTKCKPREFLHARGVVCGSESHGELAEKCFWATKLNLPVKPTDREAEREISTARAEKQALDGGCVNLPWLQTLTSGWEDSPASLPDVDRFSIETHKNSTVESAQTINYRSVRGKVKPQTKTSANPYRPRAVLNKGTQQVVTADCTCIVGVQSGCKHIAALLFAVVEAVERGENRSCTSSKATWAIPSNKSLNSCKPVVAEEINVLKIKANADKQILHNPNSFYRSKFDPRSHANRQNQSLENFDLDRLAEISNGDCGMLLYFKRPSLSTHQNPNLNYISKIEEVVTSNPAETVTSALSHCDEFATDTDFNQQLEDHLHITHHQQQQLALDTRNQSQSSLWYSHRIVMLLG
ncbi:hypothetical protein HOLleu_01047 [Holothuria leucospilota]|uniref:SWIM-type domain-containing protein n=1 Tax=Holothuria leucospilota TaxID=206669 RepID=A0A9Q1CQH4_HOLLE|nr:hypothetical protein HOLleu_01047 [Holothuria leucospilota]